MSGSGNDVPMRRLTPLRYPGGKAMLSPVFASIVEQNGITDGVYVEAFAGGAGVAIALLVNEYVDSVLINDIDRGVYAFWKSVVESNADLCEMIRSAPLTLREWERQREIFRREDAAADELALGFAMFYLNRTNRSGIMNGGVIGGKSQLGEWKIDARFNRDDLVDRVRRIGRYRSRIRVTNSDALHLIQTLTRELPHRALVYLDPPYYDKGQHLYTNYYRHDDHVAIADAVKVIERPWVVSYDDHVAIRRMYAEFRRWDYTLGYAARERREGAEVMFFSPELAIPRGLGSARRRTS